MDKEVKKESTPTMDEVLNVIREKLGEKSDEWLDKERPTYGGLSAREALWNLKHRRSMLRMLTRGEK